MNIHGSDNYEKMYEDIPQHILPKEYGGNGPSINELKGKFKICNISFNAFIRHYILFKQAKSL